MTASLDATALLAAIAAHPGEDTPRLEYADEIQEYGDHDRAEFIRVQVELSHMTDCGETTPSGIAGGVRAGCPVCVLKRREAALLAANRERWLKVECPECEGRGTTTVRITRMLIKCQHCDNGDIGGALQPANGSHRDMNLYQFPFTFRRGFPEVVEGVRLRDAFELVEGTCSHRSHLNASGGNWLPNQRCPSCGGNSVRYAAATWQPTPWLRRVLRHHKTLEVIPLVDHVPSVNHRGGYQWLNDAPDNEPDSLPRVLFEALRGGIYTDGVLAVYPTEAEAREASGRAVVQVGRACPDRS